MRTFLIKTVQYNFFNRETLWASNSYTSLALLDRTNDDDNTDDDDSTDEDDNNSNTDNDNNSGDLNYVVGDVTQPQNVGSKDAIVLHCVGECIHSMYLYRRCDRRSLEGVII